MVAGQWQKHGGRLDIEIINSGAFAEIKTNIEAVAAGLSAGCTRRSTHLVANILSLEAISKSFGAVVIADRLDLALAEGEALGMLGPKWRGQDHAVRHHYRHHRGRLGANDL